MLYGMILGEIEGKKKYFTSKRESSEQRQMLKGVFLQGII
jgi:uncharacterized protein (UPF0128 family)